MAKLNYERDVKPLAKSIELSYGIKVTVREVVSGWSLYINDGLVYSGTLRECYCFVMGMQNILELKNNK